MVFAETIFDIEGEQGFRKRERAVLDECTRRKDIVRQPAGRGMIRKIVGTFVRVVWWFICVPHSMNSTVVSSATQPPLCKPTTPASLADLITHASRCTTRSRI